MPVKLREVNAVMLRVLRASERLYRETELWLKLLCVMAAASALGIMFVMVVGRVYAVTGAGAVIVFFIFARALLWVVETVCCFSILAGQKAQDRSQLFTSSKYGVD